MKKYSKIVVAVLSFTLILASCSKKDKEVKPAGPSFESIEVGHDNSQIGYAGQDIHTEAEILAPGKIQSVQVVIHRGDGEDGWEFDKFYEDYNGQRNATFHKHIDIPADVAPGEYHFHFYVTDENGQTAKKEVKVQIKADPDVPTVEDLNAHMHGSDRLHVKAKVSAPDKIEKLTVEIHGPEKKEVEFTDMKGQTSYEFNQEIDISDLPAGNYHIHFGVTDQKGREIEEESDHFDKE